MATKKKTPAKAPAKKTLPPTTTYGITGDYTGYEFPTQPAPAQQVEENVFVPDYTPVNKIIADEQARTSGAQTAGGGTSGAVSGGGGSRSVVNTYTDPTTGDIVAVYSDGSTSVLSKGKAQSDLDAAAKAEAERKLGERKSAYDLLYQQFKNYGLESLVEPLKGLITDSGVSPSEFTIRLRDTEPYKRRFAANQARIQKGLTALSEAEYLGMEDAYQGLMRNYGLPASYYTKGDLGRQEGFEKLIANDVSAAELEDRIATAQQRVLNTNPEVLKALKQFYPDLNNADILAYTLDPEKALTDIKRKVTAAEIGGAALAAGLEAGQAGAEALAGYGITKQQAMAGYQDIAGMLPRGSQLASIYGESPYTQAVAEAEVFGTAGAAEAAKKRKKLTELEQASFGGSSGVGALGRERPSYQAQTYGAGQY